MTPSPHLPITRQIVPTLSENVAISSSAAADCNPVEKGESA